VVARVTGRCAVLGDLDATYLLERGTEAELAAEIARPMAAVRNGGRLDVSLDSPVTPDTSIARVRVYCDLARELAAT